MSVDGLEQGLRESASPRRLWSVVIGAPFRRRRWIVTLALLLLGPWAWMKSFTPGPAALSIAEIPDGSSYSVAVLDHGYHTSILIEQPPGFALGPPGREQARFVEFGWGDRRFYVDSNFMPHAILAAMLLPTESVVYVRGWDHLPRTTPSSVRVLHRQVSADRLRALIALLENTMSREADTSRPPASGPVPGYRGRFYRGRESYIFWSTCNTWVVRTLERAALADSSLAVVAAGQVEGRLEGFEER